MCTLSELREEYKPSVQSVTTRHTPITYSRLVAMLYDLEVRVQQRGFSLVTTVTLLANEIFTDGKKDMCNIPCQICNKKGHEALDCFNRYTDKFPLTNNREWSV